MMNGNWDRIGINQGWVAGGNIALERISLFLGCNGGDCKERTGHLNVLHIPTEYGIKIHQFRMLGKGNRKPKWTNYCLEIHPWLTTVSVLNNHKELCTRLLKFILSRSIRLIKVGLQPILNFKANLLNTLKISNYTRV